VTGDVANDKQLASADEAGVEIDIDGGLVRLRTRYDPRLVEQLRALPGRRFIRERSEWVLPARRAALAEVAALVERLGDHARTTDRADRRLARVRPGRIESREGQFELSFAYDPRRLARVRSIPERRYQPHRRSWTVPITRAGALALLALLEDGEFTAPPELVDRVARLAAGREATASGADGGGPGREADAERRASPAPHWRHVTRGPIFVANPQPREWVEGVGWCVRVRVDPTRRWKEGR
jgi:hypothetical protein